MNRCFTFLAAVAFMGVVAALSGCEEKAATPPPPPSAPIAKPDAKPTSTPKKDDHDHDHADGDKHDGHDHDHDHADGDKHDDHGPTVELGSSSIGAFQVKASRDGGVAAGGEVPVDLWVAAGTGAKVGAVRAWIGAQDAKGSLKAKMELEKDNYHNHIEVPKPLPSGSKLWVEIEDDKGAKAVGSFDLKN